MINDEVLQIISRLRAVYFDFDGVFTDNRVLVIEDGREAVICNRADGLGLSRLRELGIEIAILSTEVNPVVSARAMKLNIPCFQALEDKAVFLSKLLGERLIAPEDVAFVGNDINDAACLRMVGLPVLVKDAEKEVRPFARLFLQRRGGYGAVREFCDLIWQVRSPGR